MTTKIEKIRDTMFKRPDPVIFRSVAYIAAAGVVGTDQLMGASWRAFVAAILLVAAIDFVQPTTIPKDRFRNRISAALAAIRSWPSWIQLACTIVMIVGIAIQNYRLGGVALGREFNIFLVPIFLSSLLFGLPLAILTWLLSFLAAYYCLIPPAYSFAIGSVKDFADIIGYFYLGLITLAIPVLIRASSATATAEQQR